MHRRAIHSTRHTYHPNVIAEEIVAIKRIGGGVVLRGSDNRCSRSSPAGNDLRQLDLELVAVVVGLRRIVSDVHRVGSTLRFDPGEKLILASGIDKSRRAPHAHAVAAG